MPEETTIQRTETTTAAVEPITDENGVVVGLEYPSGTFGDPTAEDILFIAYGVVTQLEYAKDHIHELEQVGYPQVALDAYQAAFRTAQRLLQRHEANDFRNDVEEIDADLLVDIAETFTPVAPAFVDEFDLPVEQPTQAVHYPVPAAILGGIHG